ncbi:MAG: alpha/beta fold hydrolase [Planctomycetes bacterium]|nr:alpha/beta fold hydrolase [Planctomycetota bacterium]
MPEPATPDPGPLAESLPTSDPPYRSVSVRGKAVAYTEEGDPAAPPIVLLHGVPGSVRDFRYLAPQLSSALRVFRLELPGFAANLTVPLGDPSPEGRARFVLEFADALGLGCIALLGHSMGGGPAIAAASLHPERVSGIFLLASLGTRRHRGVRRSRRFFRVAAGLLAVPGLRGWLAHKAREAYRRLGFPRVEEFDARAFRAHALVLAAVDFDDMARLIDAVKCPALVAYACDDKFVETPISEELARRLPGAEALRFETGGHQLQKNRAAEIGRAVVARLGGGPVGVRPLAASAPLVSDPPVQ